MESTAVESGVPSAVETAAVNVTVCVAMHRGTVRRPAISMTRPVAPTWMRAIIATPVVVRTPVRRTPVSVIPRTYSDEHSIHEIAWRPVAVWGASIWVIRVVAVCAGRLRPDCRVRRSNPDPNSHRNLCLRIRGGENQNSQQSCIF